MSKYTVKQIALMKQEFLKSDFGKLAAEEITKLHGQHHEKAESMELKPWQKAAHSDRAAGINEVIQFFTSDVALLDAGYFNDEKEEEQKASS